MSYYMLQKRKGKEVHSLHSVPTGQPRKMPAHSKKEPSPEEGGGKASDSKPPLVTKIHRSVYNIISLYFVVYCDAVPSLMCGICPMCAARRWKESVIWWDKFATARRTSSEFGDVYRFHRVLRNKLELGRVRITRRDSKLLNDELICVAKNAGTFREHTGNMQEHSGKIYEHPGNIQWGSLHLEVPRQQQFR
jgi:hypothetical protein